MSGCVSGGRLAAAERLAAEIAGVLVAHRARGGVVVNVTPEGPLFAKVEVVDGDDGCAYCVTVEEIVARVVPRG